MDYEAVTTMISTLGFPIVCVIGLAFFIWKVWTHYRDGHECQYGKIARRCIEREKILTKTIQENQKIVEKAVETLAFYETNLTDIKADVNEIKEIVFKKGLTSRHSRGIIKKKSRSTLELQRFLGASCCFLNGIQEVSGSIPLISTKKFRKKAYFVAFAELFSYIKILKISQKLAYY